MVKTIPSQNTKLLLEVFAFLVHLRDQRLELFLTLLAGVGVDVAGIAPPEKLTKKQRKLWDYMRLHPEVTEFSTLAKRTGLARNTVKKHYEMVAAMLGEMSE